jgi:dihydrofolate reductase
MDKKNIVFIARSIDGYIAGKNGELDWLESVPGTNTVEMGWTPLMETIDALVMGRKTYEVVINFGGPWPYSKPVFVLSNTLAELPDELVNKVSVIQGNPKDILVDLHSRGYNKLYIDGGTTIQSFLKEDLIDEMIITTIPILLGGGFSLFGELDKPLAFDLVERKVFLNQIVQDKYRR